jgi:hypothetical protein
MKYFLALLFAFVVGAAAHAAGPTTTGEWRWIEMGNLTDHWAPREGLANVEMKNGMISAQLMLEDSNGAPLLLEGGSGALYEISGTYRLGKPGLVQEGTLNVTVTTLHSDFGDHVPNTGTYRKVMRSGPPMKPDYRFTETIILSDTVNAFGLIKATK